MSLLQKFAAQIAAHKEVNTIDMNVAQTGGGGKLWPEGYVLARFTEYVETGNHAQTFTSPSGVTEKKDPAPQVKLGFRMYGPGYEYLDDTGEFADAGQISTFELTLSQNEKAKTFLLFKKMNYDGTAKHFTDLLGKAFMIKIIHTKSKAANSKPRSNLDLTSVLPPLDPLSKRPYDVPEADEKYFRLFLWDLPSWEQWESIQVERKEGESTEAYNKRNFLQSRIISAANFPGSPIEEMLANAGVDVSGIMAEAAAEAEEFEQVTPEEQAIATPKATAPAVARPAAPAPRAAPPALKRVQLPTAPAV